MGGRYGQGSMHYDPGKRLWVGAVELEPDLMGRRRRKFVRTKTKTALVAKMREVATARTQRDAARRRPVDRGQVARPLGRQHGPSLDVAPGTARSYRWLCSKYLIPALGHIRLGKLTAEHVEKMMNAMRDDGLSPRTIAYSRAVLRLALHTAGSAAGWPATSQRSPGPPRSRQPSWTTPSTAEEAALVLKAAKGDRLEALAVLVLAVGLRQGEALRLRWPDIDLKAATVTVTRAKTASGVRTVAVPAFAVHALRRHQRAQKREQLAARVGGGGHRVRLDRRDRPRSPKRAPLVARPHHRRRGRPPAIPRLPAHRATLMLNNGVPLEVVSATLGHAGLAITADVYAKVRAPLQKTAATAMEAVLGGGGR